MNDEHNRAEVYRKKFIENPPEGFDVEEIKEMDDEAILDMYYFLYEDG